MEEKQENKPAIKTKRNFSVLYDKYYKILFIIPVVLFLISLVSIISFYSQTGDLMHKDVSLSGGTTITINGDIDSVGLEAALKEKFDSFSIRKLTDFSTGKTIATIIETSSSSEEIKPEIEKFLGYLLNDSNSSIEFSGPSLGENFYKQLMLSLLAAFILMSIVIFVMFRSFIPSIAVIFAAFADIVMPLALLNFLEIKISIAGIAAFLMLIGYSVDTDILLTSRALKKGEGTLNSRIFSSFKTGIFMTITALFAVLPAFFIVTGLPESFRQIFLILGLGLFADILNTWFTNAGIIKWYCTRKGIE